MATEPILSPDSAHSLAVPPVGRTAKEGGTTRPEAPQGLEFERYYTAPGVHPFDTVEWELRDAVISNERGEKVFEQKGVEVPKFWSQTATNVVVSKYFRGHLGTSERETSVKQLIDRVVNTIASWADATATRSRSGAWSPSMLKTASTMTTRLPDGPLNVMRSSAPTMSVRLPAVTTAGGSRRWRSAKARARWVSNCCTGHAAANTGWRAAPRPTIGARRQRPNSISTTSPVPTEFAPC